jgi:hypothetical protein
MFYVSDPASRKEDGENKAEDSVLLLFLWSEVNCVVTTNLRRLGNVVLILQIPVSAKNLAFYYYGRSGDWI